MLRLSPERVRPHGCLAKDVSDEMEVGLKSMRWQRCAGGLLAVLMALALAGCGSTGTTDDKMGNLLVSPGKYRLYDCAQLDDAAKPSVARERELKGLIAEAGHGVSGDLVAAAAYKPEYYQVHGELNEMRARAVELNCKTIPGESVPEADGSLDGVARARR
ncbi:MAG: hypothetical protein GC182_20870 [Rhodopseudomonas sp.]|nr:hypothetical protein [Rhodopseudomonas sp.]